MPIDEEQPLRFAPAAQIGIALPSPLNVRLDELVAHARLAGENTSRKEILAALILAAPEAGTELSALLRGFRQAKARDAALKGADLEDYLRDARRPPGPRPGAG